MCLPLHFDLAPPFFRSALSSSRLMQSSAMASHEWPPSSSSLSMRRKLTKEALAAVDWHKPPRFNSYSSDEEDNRSSPHSREPFEEACQSSGYGVGKGVVSSGSGDSKGFTTTHMISYKEAKVKLPANRKVDHTSLALHQSSAPLCLKACPFSGPLKLAGRIHLNRPTAMPVDVTNKKTSALSPREPLSPEVSCLGHVRVKGTLGHNTDHSIAEDDHERHTREGKKGGCLTRRKRREAAFAVAVTETTETRRERAAALARTLTSLFEDLRKFEMEKEGYEPAVPPPNSLLLMRGLGSKNKSPVQEIGTISDEGHSLSAENDIGSVCENTFDGDVCFSGMKMRRENTIDLAIMNVQREQAAQQVLPLSEIKSYSLAQNSSLSELKKYEPVDHYKDHPQELALWQRRAFAKLDTIDTKMCAKVAGKRPATK